MKNGFILSLFVLLANSVSAQTLVLDAACKIVCHVDSITTEHDMGYSTREVHKQIYVDFVSLSRKQIDERLAGACAKYAVTKANLVSSDCEYFKH